MRCYSTTSTPCRAPAWWVGLPGSAVAGMAGAPTGHAAGAVTGVGAARVEEEEDREDRQAGDREGEGPG